MKASEIAKRILSEPGEDMALRLEAFRALFGADVRKQAPTIIEALEDKRLLGGLPAFADLGSWRPWLTFLSALYGLPLPEEEEERFRRLTGRSSYAPPPGGYKEAVVVTGVQSGKSRIASTIAAYEGLIATPETDGTSLFAAVLAQDFRGARRTIFSYAAAPFDASPALGRRVVNRTAQTIELDSGVVIAAYPCRPASIRGIRARVLVLDEFAYYIGSDAAATDREMLRAARGRLATTGGRLVILSSPYGQSGALWDLHRQHYGRDDSPVLVWQASAPEMNPRLPLDYLDRLKLDDPEAYRSEVLGEFRAGTGRLFDPEALDAVTVEGPLELAPAPGTPYAAFVDPSGGCADAFAIAIGHKLPPDGRTVVDCARAWAAPFNPAEIVREASALLRSYGVYNVWGDRYGGEWPREGFEQQGIDYAFCPHAKSELYLSLLAAVNSKQVEIPRHQELVKELRGLERRRGPGGQDKVDHRPGAHDDLANVVAGVVMLLMTEGASARPSFTWL